MGQLKTPLVLGFGHKMRQGKDHAAQHILRERNNSTLCVVKIAFADALRKEVNDAAAEIMASNPEITTYEQAYEVMCEQWDAEFIPNAPVEENYPHGKQRYLLQAIGQGRREEEPDYWTTRWQEQINSSGADAVLVTDMRYPNEADLINSLGGFTIRFTRTGYTNPDSEAAAHISENALNEHPFDFRVTAPDGDLEGLHSQALNLFDQIIS